MNILGPKIRPELAEELAKLVKRPEDLFGPGGLFQEIKKSLMERLLEGEMDEHLGYDKGDKLSVVSRNDGQSFAKSDGDSEGDVLLSHVSDDDSQPVAIEGGSERACTFDDVEGSLSG